MAFSWEVVRPLADTDVPDVDSLIARLEQVVDSYTILPTPGDGILKGDVRRA